MSRRISLGLVGVLVSSMLVSVSVPVSAQPSGLPAPPADKIIPHTEVKLTHTPVSASPDSGPRPATTWPSAGEATVVLAGGRAPEHSRAADAGAPTAGPLRAGNLPVSVASAAGPQALRVRLADRASTQQAGVSGVLVSLDVTEGDAGTITVGVDYSSFRNAGGADFGSRLRLVRLPACALTTPEVAACQVQTPLPSDNDALAQVVSARVPVSEPSVSSRSGDVGGTVETGTVIAAVAGSSGPQGTFEASSLAPSGTWSVSGNSGGFGWSYPITVPPAATGAAVAPKVALNYSSSAVDGRNAATNSQSSWIGSGWDYAPGFIERTYRTCSEDEGLPAAQQTPDLCWAGQIVTMSLGGESVPLVYDDTSRTWHAGDDGGARVELKTEAANGVYRGEHWKVTTADGVTYWFGRHRGPGWTNQEQTNSAWAVPVYGPRTGDPCFNPAGFAQSSCAQGWRWNLDFVEDPHGNVTTYYYAPETNYYGANNATTGVGYTRGGTLTRIDYGLRTINNSMYGQTVPGQVVFTAIERCVPEGGFTCDPSQFTEPNKDKWPDTPQDQQCRAGTVCNNHAPTFWSTKRLSTITTRYNTGSGPVRVDSYQLTQKFPTETSGAPQLRLDSIVRTGYDPTGGSITLPPIQFISQALHNRVPGYNNQPAMPHWRLTEIHTDTGSVIHIVYSQPECGTGTTPTDQANNTKRCFPVYWTLPFQRDPTLDYFYKYVVDLVRIQDRNGVSPTQVTSYRYLGTPAWHHDDNEIVKPKHRTYGQFRGYSQVEVRTGDPAVHDRQTLTRTTYFRGMDGDIMPGNRSRPATVTNSLGETVPDNNLYAGAVREIQNFNGDGGPQLSTEITDQITVATTATRTRTGLPALTANVVETGKKRSVTALAAGGTRTTSVTQRFDQLGRVVASTDSGDGVPELCTITRYADNTGSWIRDRVSETITSHQVCPADGVTPAPILSAQRTYYDGSTILGDVPHVGDATRTDKATANTNGTLSFATMATVDYDPAGRPTSATDALNRTTGTAYTPADGGLLSKIVTTNPKNQTSTVEMEPSRGLTIGTVDVGGHRNDASYDTLGRLTAAWKPGRTKAWGESANVTYAYLQRTDGPLAVTTKTLVDYGAGTNYVTSINLYDALGQLRQTQADDVSNPAGVENRVAKDVFYDSHGWAVRSNNRYVTTGVPATTLISVADSAVDDRTVTTFDGAGRATKATAYRGLTATWDSRTVYGGDRTTVFPPQGAVTSTTLVDVRGRTTELRQYTAQPTVSGDVVSGGTFQASSYRYTALGQLDQLRDAAGNTWTYGYDFLGRQSSAVDPDAGNRTTTYDLAGQLTSTTDARNQTLSYEYDPLGRKLHEYSGPGGTGTKLASWGYDDARQLGVGQLTSTTRFTVAGNYQVAYTYNGDGRLSKQTLGIPASETGLAGIYTTTYRYLRTGLLYEIDPVTMGGLPGEGIATTYNRYGLPDKTGGYNVYVDGSSYTPYGEPTQYRLGVLNSSGTLTFDRDAQTRRVTGVNLSVTQAFPQVDDLRYTYDPAGNVTRIVNVQGHRDNGAPTRTECFRYDVLDRLSQAWTANDNCAAGPSAGTVGGPNPYWTSWTFDAVGLRRTQVRHAIPGGPGGDATTSYTYPASGEHAVRPHAVTSTSTTGPAGTSTTGYGYDASGNTTGRTLPAGNQTLTWTEHNRLASVTTSAGTTSYVYDADGNQLIRRDPGKTTLYLPTQEITRDTASGTLTGTRYYTHNGTVVALRVGGANISYLQADLHGTAQVAVKAEAIDNHAVTRRSFDPYGNPVGAGQGTWPDTHGFLNKPHNPATGLTDIGARTYDPAIGRFQSVDPLLNPKDPQSWTGYTYANNNPTTFADPTGEFCDGCEYGGSGDHHGVGYSADGWCGCRTEEQVKDDWDVLTGRNKDPKKQPVLPGRRIPTFDELKKLPGFARYMQSGTYEEAVSDWAKQICTHQSSAVDHEFCAVADSYGLLGDKKGDLGLLAGFLVGAALGGACSALTAGIATVACAAAAGAAAGATSNAINDGDAVEGAIVGGLLGLVFGGRGGTRAAPKTPPARVISGPYGEVSATALQQAALGGGATTRVVTNLTQPPVAGRALSVASGDGADALAAAAGGAGRQAYEANIPNALLSELERVGLARKVTTNMQGVVGQEIRFMPNATEFIAPYFGR